MGRLERELHGRVVVGGAARGIALRTDVPLSFWGGLDAVTGEIIDRRHPLSGAIVTGRVLVLPHGRGSCSASGLLLEAIKNGSGPAAVITSRIDPVLSLGAILAEELYGLVMPLLHVSVVDFDTIPMGSELTIDPLGSVRFDRSA